MAFSYALRSCAEEDLSSILDYIATANPKAALDLYEKFLLIFNLLAQFPEIGRERPDLMPGIRSMALGNYIIFFEKREILEVVRILHGARDIQQNLF